MTDRPASSRSAPSLPRVVALLALVLVVAVGAVGVVLARTGDPPPPPLAEAVEPRYPDLGMAPLGDLLIGTSRDGPVYLRFTATIVNVGQGDMLVAAHRRLPFGDDWAVTQRIEDATGGYSERDTEATLVFGGDGHDHWHVARAEAHQLETEEGRVVGQLVKTGFCFFDNVGYRTSLAGSPTTAVHTSRECGGQFDRAISMGLSIGWGDEYPWYLLDQTIEITDVPDGRYRLRAIADPADFFAEVDEDNNDTWTLLDLTSSDGAQRLTIVEQGPSA